MGFLAPKTKMPEPPPPVTADSAAVQDGVTQERVRRQKAMGRQSTILSGDLGAPDASAATARTTLLGG